MYKKESKEKEGLTTKNQLVSVIVPVYNIENYVSKCVDSIIGQSYKEVEIILVDDGSTDSSPMICDEYSELYNNIFTIHKKNGGLSDARNTGVKIAKGKYISFVDGDDYIDKDYLLNLVISIESHHADIAVGIIYRDYKSKIELLDSNHFQKEIVFERSQALRFLASEGKITTCAWDKLYRKELVPWLCFPKGKLFEDKYIMHLVFSNCKRITMSPNARYYYVTRTGSITNSKFNHKMMDNLDAASKRLEYYESYYPQFARHVRANECDIAIGLYISSRHDKSGKKYRKQIRKIIRRDIISYLIEEDYQMSGKIKKLFQFFLFYAGIYDIYKSLRRFTQ